MVSSVYSNNNKRLMSSVAISFPASGFVGGTFPVDHGLGRTPTVVTASVQIDMDVTVRIVSIGSFTTVIGIRALDGATNLHALTIHLIVTS